VEQKFLGLVREFGREFRFGIFDDGNDLLAEDAAGGVDLLDRQQLGVLQRRFADRHGAGERVEDANLDVAALGFGAFAFRSLVPLFTFFAFFTFGDFRFAFLGAGRRRGALAFR